MKSALSPIHWECSLVENGKPSENARVVDLRTLPEEIKIAIIQAALNVGFRYHNGEYETEEDSEEDAALADLACAVEAIRPHMHDVALKHCP
jgi:hypothetical protein